MEWQSNKRFCKLYPHVLRVEGGYVNDPKDKGGATKFGIAYNFNAGFLRKYGINTPNEIIKLTKEQALEVYYQRYWLPSQADEIQDDKLSLVYFDHAVNGGIGEADRLLAKLDKNHWYYKGNGENANFFWGLCLELMLHRLWAYLHYRDAARYGFGWFNRIMHISKVLKTI